MNIFIIYQCPRQQNRTKIGQQKMEQSTLAWKIVPGIHKVENLWKAQIYQGKKIKLIIKKEIKIRLQFILKMVKLFYTSKSNFVTPIDPGINALFQYKSVGETLGSTRNEGIPIWRRGLYGKGKRYNQFPRNCCACCWKTK